MGPLEMVPPARHCLRTAPPCVRSVLDGLSFPKVSHIICQLLPASAPRSTKPRPLACAAVMCGHQFRECFDQLTPLLASPRSMATRVYLRFHVNLARVSSMCYPSFPKFTKGPLKMVLPAHLCLRAALPWVRSVLDGLSFPKVSHIICQFLPASVPRSTKPRPLACAAVMCGHQFR